MSTQTAEWLIPTFALIGFVSTSMFLGIAIGTGLDALTRRMADRKPRS